MWRPSWVQYRDLGCRYHKDNQGIEKAVREALGPPLQEFTIGADRTVLCLMSHGAPGR